MKKLSLTLAIIFIFMANLSAQNLLLTTGTDVEPNQVVLIHQSDNDITIRFNLNGMD